jgi:hypothetical protein
MKASSWLTGVYGCPRFSPLDWSGRAMARSGLRMMPTFPLPSLKFRTAGFPQYGFKAGVSDRVCPFDAACTSLGLPPPFVLPAARVGSPFCAEGRCAQFPGGFTPAVDHHLFTAHPVSALDRDLAQLRSESGPPLPRDSPSCSKIEPNITSYSACPDRIPRRPAF